MNPETLAELSPPSAPSPAPPALNALRSLHDEIGPLALWVVAAGCAACALLLGMAPASLGLLGASGAPALALTALFLALALAAAGATRLAPARQGWALGGLLTALAAAVFVSALGLGWGLDTPALALPGLLVCVLCASHGVRAGAGLAGLWALGLLALAGLGSDSGLPVATRPGPPALLQLGGQLLLTAAGLAGGALLARLLGRSLRSAQDREHRFRRLLALAADAYWEVDPQYRLLALADQAGDRRPLTPEQGLGRPPWELPQFECDPDTLDLLQADMDTRLPFRDLPASWLGRDGRARKLRLSGEPRFDERGVFTGYWGVARDVSAMDAAREALEATETRYQELFSRIPTPLVLHRGGRVLDANPAAVQMFGHADLHAMVDTDMLATFEGGDSRERARRRMETLLGQPPGTALPVADFRLIVQRHVVSVRATSVRIDAQGGAAMLDIFVDDTERLAAEEAVRRSEAMLSHLVATSPDLITLTDLASGRYAMVNHAFERVSGWSAAEAVGRTSADLGIWGDPEARARFADDLRRRGAVTDVPVEFVAKNGATFSMIVSAARFVMDRREYMVINARDVTETERERLEREAILFNASVGIAVTRGRRFVLANRHFEQIYGWASGELVGQPDTVVWHNAQDHAEVQRLAGPVLLRGELVELERPGLRRDGSSFLARVRGRAIDPHRPAQAGTVWIVEDVTERREAERALARARDAAEAASRAKSAFLANTSHELRTPLNGMIGLARMAAAEDIEAPLRRQYLDQLAGSAQALAAIISDILDLSKIEAGKLRVESRVFELGTELRGLAPDYASQAALRGLGFTLEIAAAAEGLVQGDPLRLRQIVGNYLSNAIKFTARGQVALRVTRPAGGLLVRLEVQDSGPGIDAATRARLFQPFTQADDSTTRRFGGTGLGLSICRELAALMGGRVGVDSEPGQGSCFWAEIPLPAQSMEAPPMPSATAASSANSAHSDGPDNPLAGRPVLLVEDNPVNMLIAAAMLERWGMRVTQAEDGRQALDVLERAAADGRPMHAVLMDLQMPVMSGHEAARILRTQAWGRDVPVIALTAAALVSERDEALRAGMDDFLTKPIDAEKLRATLERWCARPQ